jgi:hypothetical protein
MISALTDSDMAPVTEDAALDCSLGSVQKGTISEKLFEVCALRRGWYVASNSGGGDDFDHIIKRPEKSNGVVIQTRLAQGRFIHGTWRYTISFCQQNGRPYSLTAFDVLAVHLADADEFIFFTRARPQQLAPPRRSRRISNRPSKIFYPLGQQCPTPICTNVHL